MDDSDVADWYGSLPPAQFLHDGVFVGAYLRALRLARATVARQSALHERTTIDVYDGAGYETGVLGGQEGGRSGNVIRHADAPQWRV